MIVKQLGFINVVYSPHLPSLSLSAFLSQELNYNFKDFLIMCSTMLTKVYMYVLHIVQFIFHHHMSFQADFSLYSYVCFTIGCECD